MTAPYYSDDLENPPQAEPWMTVAVCATTDPDMFFPEKGGTARDARKVCNNCEVRAECLKFAVDRGIDHGVYGGVTANKRRQMRGAA